MIEEPYQSPVSSRVSGNQDFLSSEEFLSAESFTQNESSRCFESDVIFETCQSTIELVPVNKEQTIELQKQEELDSKSTLPQGSVTQPRQKKTRAIKKTKNTQTNGKKSSLKKPKSP